MANIIKKYGRYIAIVVLAAVLATLIPAAIMGFKMREANAGELSSDDKKTAADISNTTGAKIEEVIDLKKQGRSWNEVLDYLKGRGDNPSDKDKRDKILTNDGLGDDYVDMLKKEGFKLEDIMEAKLLAERVIFQLNEITGENDKQAEPPKVDTVTPGDNQDKKDDDTSSYADLKGKLDIKTAVKLMLKLKNDFGSFEKVLDEYLFALQAGINLEDYLTDKKAYQKQKDEKSLAMDLQKVITMAKIEEEMLKKVQEANTKGKSDTLAGSGVGAVQEKSPVKDDAPKLPLPEVKDVKPKNPTDDVMNEIKQINPMGN